MAFSPRASLAAFSTSVLLAAACGEVVGGAPFPGTSGSTGALVASTTVTSSSGEGDAGGGAAECVPKPEGTGDSGEPTCEDLARLALSHPVLEDADGDGQLSAGETGYLRVNLDEIAGVGFWWYPGVIFETAAAGVSVSSNNWLYGMVACQSSPMRASITVGDNVAPGTVVTITASVAMLHHVCPDAYAIEVPITVH